MRDFVLVVGLGSKSGTVRMREEFLFVFIGVSSQASCHAWPILICARVYSRASRRRRSGPFLPSREHAPLSRLLVSSSRIRFQSGSSCTRNPENWTERSRLLLPTSVLQMNDQLESHKSAGSIVVRAMQNISSGSRRRVLLTKRLSTCIIEEILGDIY